jgi:hypothetical protein
MTSPYAEARTAAGISPSPCASGGSHEHPPPSSARCPSCGGSSRLTAKGNIRKKTCLRQRWRGDGASVLEAPAKLHPHLHFTRQRIVSDEKMLRKLDGIVMTPAAPLLQYLPNRRFGEGRYRGHANASSTLQEQRSGLRPKSDRGVQGRGAASDLRRRRWSPRSLCTSE